MAKGLSKTQAVKKGADALVQRHEEYDDTPLPDADLISKLIIHDPSILEWYKQKFDKEQEYRHNYSNTHLKSINDSNKRHHNTSRLGLLTFVFIFAVLCSGSFYLILHGFALGGSIFGGTSLLIAISVLVSNIYNRNPNKPSNKSNNIN